MTGYEPWRRLLRPGDGDPPGLNRMLPPDTVGTGGDPIPVLPIGISSRRAQARGVCRRDRRDAAGYAGIGATLKANAAGIALRDPVHAIPLYAIKQASLTVEKKGKKNTFTHPEISVCRI